MDPGMKIQVKFHSSQFKIILYSTECFNPHYGTPRAPLVAQMVKNLPTMEETRVQSLGWEDPLEKGMDTHYSFLAWRISWTQEPGRLQYMELQRVIHD